ncbi:thermonuclease family protein [Brevundimonas sp.]|uniref:thermonuclease family protein n=1 Tax=Brevundimonas sp. TaxID=1871086 RepID=UPI0035B43B13
MSAAVLICLTLVMHDADSGRCRTADAANHSVRLQGVDAGELAPFTRCRQRPDIWACSPIARSTATEARARARQLAARGARCSVVDTDRYRRKVVVCTVNGRDMGRTLVREGLAISETNYGDPYRSEENAARRERKGIWQ